MGWPCAEIMREPARYRKTAIENVEAGHQRIGQRTRNTRNSYAEIQRLVFLINSCKCDKSFCKELLRALGGSRLTREELGV